MTRRPRRGTRMPLSRALLPVAGAALMLLLALGPGATYGRAQDEGGAASEPERAPPHLRELGEWIDAKNQQQAAAMPLEARLAYRRGVTAWRAGEEAEAITLLRGAAELDPSFAAPHLTLAGWYLGREPSQALLSWASLLHRWRADFTLQVELLANAAYFGLQALFFGLLGVALLIIGLHQHELRHVWRERLAIVLSPRSSRLWAWTILLLPWALGMGLALPALVMLGMLWPVLRMKERAVFVLLAGMVAAGPFAASAMGRLALPIRPEGAPFHGVAALDQEPDRPGRQSEIQALAERHPQNPFVQFGLGWVARREGDLAQAETAYRRVLELWPNDARAHNNLGNLLAMQGRFDEALEHYRASGGADPRNAAAYFNASQVHTRMFDYRAASDAVARASALDFEMVKAYQARSVGGDLPLVDQWIEPKASWSALIQAAPSDVPPALPPIWARMIETSGWPFTGLALASATFGLMLGLLWQRRMPLRTCSNCSRPVCRRCAQRLREVALCPECAVIAARAESGEFGRVLLGQQRRRVDRVRGWARAAASALVPGFALLARRRLPAALALQVAAAMLVAAWLDVRAPFALSEEPGSGAGSGWTLAACWIGIYALSLLGLLGASPEAEPQQPVRVPHRPSAIDPPARAA